MTPSQLRYGPGRKQVISDKQNKQDKTLNPEFYRSFEIELTIPGACRPVFIRLNGLRRLRD